MITYTIAGHLTGSMWWPVGVPAAVPVEYSWSPDDRRLRDVADHIATERGGDFADAPRFTADSVLIVTRTGPHGQSHTHYRELAAFRSVVEDFVALDRYASDFLPRRGLVPRSGRLLHSRT